jgi:zinc transport system substrate-binding protein
MRTWRAALWLAPILALTGCGERQDQKLRVLATTTHLSQLAERIGGEHVAATVIIPPGACPGHYDLRPRDMQAAARGGILLKHGWEVFTDRLAAAAEGKLKAITIGETFVDRPVDAGSPGAQIVSAAQPANLMIPGVRANAARQVGEALAKADPAHAAHYRRRASELAGEISTEGKRAREDARARGLVATKVIVAEPQASFLGWLGMDVVRQYGRPEEITPKSLHEVLVAARRAGVRLVVDNLQSAPEAGRGMAEELGAVHVTLSNFPGGTEDAPDWQSTLRSNIAALARATGG